MQNLAFFKTKFGLFQLQAPGNLAVNLSVWAEGKINMKYSITRATGPADKVLQVFS